LLFSTLLLATGCATSLRPPADSAFRSPPDVEALLAGPIRTIVLDPGHGGHDPGATHFGVIEKGLALDIARRVGERLRTAGFTVVMTRETDHFVPLSERAGLANRLDADLFVSIHLNANPSDAVWGAEVYYPPVSIVRAGAGWPPCVGPEEIGVPSPPVQAILWDLVLTHARAESQRAAEALCTSLGERLRVPCRVKGERFVVLREARMPAVLIEVGFLSNRAESQRLTGSGYREAAAEAVAEGLFAYIRSLGAEHF
jgi:N-acetylmuramoyl-L-alanine amidase